MSKPLLSFPESLTESSSTSTTQTTTCCSSALCSCCCTTRDNLYLLLSDPSSSVGASIFGVIYFLLVVETIALLIVGAFPYYWANEPIGFYYLRIGNIIFFTADFTLRFLLTREHRVKWFIRVENMADFLALIPFYLNFFVVLEVVEIVEFLRVLRLLRLIWIVRLFRYFEGIDLVYLALKRSLNGLLLLVFSIGLATILFGMAIFHAEHTKSYFNETELVWYYETGLISPFQDPTAGFWWAIVTITTLGYGDMYPYSATGKIVASILMVVGMIALTFPMTILSSSFAEVYDEAQTRKRKIYLKDKKTNLEKVRLENNPHKTIQSLSKEMNRIGASIEKLTYELEGVKGIYKDIKELHEILSEQLEEVEEQ